MIFNEIYSCPLFCIEYKQHIWQKKKQEMINNWSKIRAFEYYAFMSYMVVHVHGNVHDPHLHYREYQILMRRNGTWLFVSWTGHRIYVI